MVKIASVLAFVASLALPAAARAGDGVAFIVNSTLIKPIGAEGRVAQSAGAGADFTISPDEPVLISIGGYAAFGQPAGDKSLRDIYDFHFDVGFKKDSGRDDVFMPYGALGLDVLSLTTREKGRPTLRGTTLGVNAQAGIMGHIGSDWMYRAGASYLGAIVPGTGDDLGALVLQVGLGASFY